MRRVRKIIAVLLYLVIVSLALELKPRELFDLRQFLLVAAGGIILYLPAIERGGLRKWRNIDFALLSRNTVYASYIETFVLLFGLFSRVQAAGQAEDPFPAEWMKNIALNLRPLLYGICIWTALGGEGEKKNGGTEQGTAQQTKGESLDRIWTAQECFQRFWEMGLTRREAEVAVQVCKGLGNKEIAMELNISETTVKKHVSNIFEKLGLTKREEIKGVLEKKS